jgi:hypothetical protein
MERLNVQLFLALNAPSAPDPLIVTLAKICAEDLVFLVAGLAAALWVWGRRGEGGPLIASRL